MFGIIFLMLIVGLIIFGSYQIMKLFVAICVWCVDLPFSLFFQYRLDKNIKNLKKEIIEDKNMSEKERKIALNNIPLIIKKRQKERRTILKLFPELFEEHKEEFKTGYISRFKEC